MRKKHSRYSLHWLAVITFDCGSVVLGFRVRKIKSCDCVCVCVMCQLLYIIIRDFLLLPSSDEIPFFAKTLFAVNLFRRLDSFFIYCLLNSNNVFYSRWYSSTTFSMFIVRREACVHQIGFCFVWTFYLACTCVRLCAFVQWGPRWARIQFTVKLYDKWLSGRFDYIRCQFHASSLLLLSEKMPSAAAISVPKPATCSQTENARHQLENINF